MLTDFEVRALEAASNPYKRADGGELYLLVKPTGAKLWRFDYRFGGSGKLSPLAPIPKCLLRLRGSGEIRPGIRSLMTLAEIGF